MYAVGRRPRELLCIFSVPPARRVMSWSFFAERAEEEKKPGKTRPGALPRERKGWIAKEDPFDGYVE